MGENGFLNFTEFEQGSLFDVNFYMAYILVGDLCCKNFYVVVGVVVKDCFAESAKFVHTTFLEEIG